MKRPKVIFLDAVGTIIGVRGTVGEVYCDIARVYGVEADPVAVNDAFYQSFKAASTMAFPGIDEDEIEEREFGWWWAIAAQTFQRAGVLDQFDNFAGFFASLYAHFATAEPWFVYADVRWALEHWQSQGIELGIISNFDSRLHRVLPALKLDGFFSSVTLSTQAGVAKPDRQIFELALAKHNCAPEDAWHVGDSFRQDYEGARTAGLRGVWLRRNEVEAEQPISA
jgi:putative hydrolase of the HAD superfamily